jgi:MFS family permease
VFADTRPLRVPAYRRLWLANIVTMIGAQLTVVAVPAQIFALTRSSAYVGLTGVFGLVPLVFFGLYGGALADVLDRRRLLMVSTVGLIGTSALFWVQAAAGLDSVWLILCLFSVQQSFFAINSPTRSALLPRIVPADQLPAANSLNMTVFQAGAIAGPLVGGALIPVLGFSWLYLADTLCLFATLWAVVLLPPMPPEGVTGRAGLRSVLDGLAYLRGHRVLLMSFLVDIIAMVFGMPRALFPQIAHEGFGGPVDGGLAFAALFAGIPAGAVLGGVFSGWISRVSRQGLAVVVAIVVWGAGMVLFGVAALLADGRAGGFLALGVLGLVVGGAADMVSAAFRSTMLQEAAGDAVRGRLQGVFTVVVAGGPRVADVAHGGVAAVAGAGATAAGGGALVIVLVVVAAAAIPVFVRYRVVRPRLGP